MECHGSNYRWRGHEKYIKGLRGLPDARQSSHLYDCPVSGSTRYVQATTQSSRAAITDVVLGRWVPEAHPEIWVGNWSLGRVFFQARSSIIKNGQEMKKKIFFELFLSFPDPVSPENSGFLWALSCHITNGKCPAIMALCRQDHQAAPYLKHYTQMTTQTLLEFYTTSLGHILAP